MQLARRPETLDEGPVSILKAPVNDPLVDSHIRVLRETGGDDGATYHFAIFSETRPAVLRRVRKGVSGSTVGPAALARSMRAEHVVPLLSFRATDDLGYVLEDYIKGISLHDILASGRPMRWEVAAQIIASAAKAIDAVRKKLGANVRHISADRLLVTFAGGTWFADSTRELRGTETTKWSFRALSPEEAASATLEPRRQNSPEMMAAGEREITFSLGLMLRDLLAGRAFYRATTLDEAKREGAAFATETALAGIDGPVRDVLARALSKNPDDRFSSLLGFEVALRALPLASTTDVATHLGEVWKENRNALEAWLDEILSESAPALSSPDSSEDIATRAFRRSSRTDAPAAAAPPPHASALTPPPQLAAQVAPPPPPQPADLVRDVISGSLVPEASPTIKSLPEDEPDEDEEARTAPFSREELLSRFQRSPNQPTVPPKHLQPKPRISGTMDAVGRYVHISSNPPGEEGATAAEPEAASLPEPVTREIPAIAAIPVPSQAETAVNPAIKLPVVDAGPPPPSSVEAPKPPSSRKLPPPSQEKPRAAGSDRHMPRPPSSGQLVVREEWRTGKVKDHRREVEDDSRTRPFVRDQEARTKSLEAHSRPILEIRETGEFDSSPDTTRSEPSLPAAKSHAPPQPHVASEPGESVILSSSLSRVAAPASSDAISEAPRTDPDVITSAPKSGIPLVTQAKVERAPAPPSREEPGIPTTQRESAYPKARPLETAPMTPFAEAAPVIATPIAQVASAAPAPSHTNDPSTGGPQDSTVAMHRRKAPPNPRLNDPTVQVATQRRRSAWFDVVLLVVAIGIVSAVAYFFFANNASESPAEAERPRAVPSSTGELPSLALVATGSGRPQLDLTAPLPKRSGDPALPSTPSGAPHPSAAASEVPSGANTGTPLASATASGASPSPSASATPSGTAEADPAPAAPRAYVTVICDPWCDQVEEGGQKLGASPLVRVTMSPGKHTFKLHWSEPPAEKTAVVDAKEGETTVLRVSP